VAVSESPQTPEEDLASLDFWGRPAEERDRYFEVLRRSAPISHHQPLEDPLGLPDQERMDYCAIVRYEDIRRSSRDPESFRSGRPERSASVSDVNRSNRPQNARLAPQSP